MSREITFRAWNKRDGYMQDVAELSWRHGGLHVEDAGVHIGNGWVSINENCKEARGIEPDAILEQFTGLKDKDGQDIYEGDIVRSTEPEIKAIAEVRYDAPAFVFRWTDGTTTEWQRYAEHNDIQVIGNIHQNPELLEA